MQDLGGRTAVMTGGGDGIGRALVLALAQAGADVAVLDIREDAAQSVAEEARSLGVRALAHGCDVSDEASIEAAAARVAAELGPVHVVWANAGLGIAQGFADGPRSNLRWMYSVNVDGVIDTIRAFVPVLREQEGFRAVGVTGSMAGLTHPEGLTPAYAASKYAVVGIAEGLRCELAPEGIGVTLLCPGLVNTRIWDGARARPERFGGPRHLPEEIGERWRSQGMSASDVAAHGVDALREGRFFALMPDDEERAGELTRRHEELMAGIRYPG
ncbi:MAG: SDR family NAD(P)-dependent oxidoreductase [Myxococcota bacterium]|nr:SDR family NAD(P)-dependent oxidoreductase [Myxococcota bacterium]